MESVFLVVFTVGSVSDLVHAIEDDIRVNHSTPKAKKNIRWLHSIVV